ncbi:MAG: hypothetical protein ACP6IS_11205 [Candidatus Asgardarchaeia archaeon]
MVLYVCPFCDPKREFPSKEEMKRHVLENHIDKILELLSKIPEYKRRNIKNPKVWAAGVIAGWSRKNKQITINYQKYEFVFLTFW